MKLHLSKSLRTAVLAAFAVVSPLSVTVFSGTTAIGVCAITALAPQAQAADITYNGGTVTSWTDGAAFGDQTFNDGDSIAITKDATLTLGGDVTVGLMRINENADVMLRGNGSKLSGDLNIWGTLTLRDQALGADAHVTAGTGDIVLNWGHGNPDASFADILNGFRGAIHAENSSFYLKYKEAALPAEAYRLVELLGESTLRLAGFAPMDEIGQDRWGVEYASGLSFFTSGVATINVHEGSATIQGGIAGTGELHKVGDGVLALTQSDIHHTGELFVDEGAVTWGNADAIGNVTDNKFRFTKITVSNDAVFVDSHRFGVGMADQTEVHLVDGGSLVGVIAPQVTANDVIPARFTYFSNLGGLGEHYYGTLTITGSGTIGTFTPTLGVPENISGIHRFTELVADGDGAVLSLNPSGANDTNSIVITEFDFVNDFNGTIQHGAVTDTPATYTRTTLRLARVFNDEGHTLDIKGLSTISARGDLTFEGAGTVNIDGSAPVEVNVKVLGGTLTVGDKGTLNVAGSIQAGGVLLKDGSTTATTNDGGVSVKKLTVQDAETSLTVAGDLVVEQDAKIKAGNVTVAGAAVLGHQAAISGGTVQLDGGLLLRGTSTLEGRDVMLNLSGDAAVTIQHGIKAIKYDPEARPGAEPVAIPPGSIHMTGNSKLTVDVGQDETITLKVFEGSSAGDVLFNGDVNVERFAMHGTGKVTIGDGSTLTVSKVLDMNYNGEFETHNPIVLKDNVVLSYDPSGTGVINLSSDNIRGLQHVFVDVSRATVAQLKAGINLGFQKGSEGFLDSLSYGNLLVNPTVVQGDDGYMYLKATGRKASVWDTAWGAAELATAPDQDLPVRIVKAESWGLYSAGRNDYDDQYYIKVHAIGSDDPNGDVWERRNSLFGGVSGMRMTNPTGTTIQRQIWMEVDGEFEAVAGGSFIVTQAGAALGTWNLEGDVHIQVDSTAKVGSVVAANVFFDNRGDLATTWTGDSYISVNTSDWRGSIIGAGIGSGDHVGNVEIYIHKAPKKGEVTHFTERTSSPTTDPVDYTLQYNVVGAFYNAGESTTTGNTLIVIDAASSSSSVLSSKDTFERGVFGGYLEGGRVVHNGDSRVVINGTTCTFKGNPDFVLEAAEGEDVGDTLFNTNPHEGAYSVIAGGSGYVGSITQTGDSSVCILNSSSNFNVYVVGGSFGDGSEPGPQLNMSGRTAKQTGDTMVYVKDSPKSSFTKVVAGGHLNQTIHQFLYGNSSVVLDNAGKFFPGAMVVGGHATDWGYIPAEYEGLNANDRGGTYTYGSTSVTIRNGRNFEDYVVAGHAVRDNRYNHGECTANNNTHPVRRPETTNVAILQYVEGDTNLTIDSGTYGSRVIAGNMLETAKHVNTEGTDTLSHQLNADHVTPPADHIEPADQTEENDAWPEACLAKIEGAAYTTITGGAFNGTIIGASYVDTPARFDPYEYRSHIGTVTMNISNATLKVKNAEGEASDALVGGYHIADGAGATAFVDVGDINITLANVDVTGDILGGSVVNRPQADIQQGNVNLTMLSGSYDGNIYLAGRNSASRRFRTESTTLNLSNDCQLGTRTHYVGISGGYEGNPGATVGGSKTLNFIDPVTYTNLGKTEFTNFDHVNVVEGGKVVLNQTLQLLSPEGVLIKTGKGTLSLAGTEEAGSSKLETVQVREGTLALPNYGQGSADHTVIQNLSVSEGAALDLSSGLAGISGTLNLAVGSTIMVADGQPAGSLNRLIWGNGGDNGGKVNVVLLSDITDGNTTVDVFANLKKDNISGIDLSKVTTQNGQTAFVAGIMPYVNLFNSEGKSLDTSGLNFVLDEKGKLVITGSILRSIYWEAASSGMVWSNDEFDTNWALQDGGAPEYCFRTNDVAVFSDNPGNPHVVVVNGKVEPNSVRIINGDYSFTAPVTRDASANCVDIARTLYIENATATFQPGVDLALHAKNSNVQLVGAGSTLTVNNDIEFNKLISDGAVTVNGDITMNSGTDHGGDVTANNVKLGGDSTFNALNAQDVKGNAKGTLTLNGDSHIQSVDGGTLVVNGETDITGSGTTTLQALRGVGKLTMAKAGPLTLKGASNIGELDAPTLTVHNTLDVTGELKADDITFGDLIITKARPMIQVGSVKGEARFHLDEKVVKQPRLWGDNNEYVLMSSKTAAEGEITVNDVEEKDLSTARYNIKLAASDKNITISTKVTNKNYYAQNAISENGKEGSKLLDNLYTVPGLLSVDSHEDWQKLMLSMDMMLQNGDKAGADKLAAAATGASYAALGCALQDDVYRQLRAVRNRTTTMGLGMSDSFAGENTPAYNAWFNVEGGRSQLGEDGTDAGYSLNSWGATVGADIDFSPRFTAGLALTGMYGKYSGKGCDSLSGNMDTMYATFFARIAGQKWVHTFVGTVGTADFSLDRTVATPLGSYTTTGDTTGSAFGLMYEIGRIIPVNPEKGSCIEPVFNIAWTHSSVSGIKETGSPAGVETDSITNNVWRVAVGARYQTTFGQSSFNRTSILEARLLAKAYGGDTQGEAGVGMLALPRATTSHKSAEMGTFGVEAGFGVTIPVNNAGAIFADFTLDVTGGYTNMNGTFGYRHNF